MKTLGELIEKAKSTTLKTVAVAESADLPVLESLKEGVSLGIIKPVLFGNKNETCRLAKEIDFDLTDISVIDCQNPKEAAEKAVQYVSGGKAQIVMKGLVGSDVYLRAILNKEWGLRTGSVLSHVALFEIPAYHKLLCVTDAAMNISPDAKDKAFITKNAVNFMKNIVNGKPKVAFLAHNEKVVPDNQASNDAAVLSMMAIRGQLGDIIADGPFAFDNAISKEAAKHKKIESEVAGDADIVICPDIQSGNILYKSLTYFANGKAAALIAGAKAPVILTSRADTAETKLYSIVFAVLSC
jgi:phosphate butyryltransferase